MPFYIAQKSSLEALSVFSPHVIKPDISTQKQEKEGGLPNRAVAARIFNASSEQSCVR